MKSLRSFIEDNLNIRLSYSGFQPIVACNSLNGLEEILNTCFVIHNQCRIPFPEVCPEASHKKVVDQCIIHLLKKKLYNNVLTFGYRIAGCNEVNTSLHCFCTNSNVSRIKSHEWHLLHDIMGRDNFVDLLTNYAVVQYADGVFTQLIGNRANEPHVPPSWCSEKSTLHKKVHVPIMIQKLLYKSVSFFNKENILPAGNNIATLVNEIFEPFFRKQILKKPKLISIVRKMIQNHAEIRYLQILNNVCPQKKKVLEGTHLDASTPVELVNKFMVIILQKLIPPEMFGSKRNKAKIFHYLSQLLRLPLKGSIPFSELMSSQRVQDFTWLQLEVNHGESAMKNLQDLAGCFIFWIFQFTIPRIITTFFYSTEVSSCVEILFFRHDAWIEVSRPFLNDYFSKHLVENKICRNHNSYLLSRYNHSRLRLVPKKANREFRALAIPCKGADKEEYLVFKSNFKSIVYPVQCILEYIRKKRKTHYKKLYSPAQIADHLISFKRILLRKYGKVPDLFSMKFDIESCYDSISRKKAMEVMNSVLENETGFFVRSQSFYEPSTGILKTQSVVNGCRRPRSTEVYIDNARTVYLSKEDVNDVLKSELFDTALSFGDKCYLRKDGLFQGSRLSALVVDLVYDDLMETSEIFKAQYPNECLSLRLADDFLVISTDIIQILELEKLSSKGFEEYGAKIKKDKIEISNSTCSPKESFQFCALDISLKNLQAWKQSESFNIPRMRFGSIAKTYDQLTTLFEMRLSYGTTNGLLNTPLTVVFQLYQVGVNIAQTFADAFKGKAVFLRPFKDFIHRILITAVGVCSHCPSNDTFKLQLHQAVLQSFLETLLPVPSKFENAITFLKFELNKCIYLSTVALNRER